MFYELIYVSLASWKMNSNDLNEIIKEANDKNVSKAISGCLYYNDRTFIQVLEGEKQKVLDLYTRIIKDSRHQNVEKLWEGIVEERAFPHFSMGLFVDEKNSYKNEIDKILNNIGSKSSTAKSLFTSLIKELS